MPVNTIEDVHRFLGAIPTFKNKGKGAADFSLERFEKFCDAIGNPQHDFPAIHVGGSNGKGSTCHILASIYQKAGYTVGVNTSPHIISYSERFTINGSQIRDEELVVFFKKYHSLIKSFRLTYFEISTAIAFWWFGRQKVDIGIIEVGLGGRLDATNIITPVVSVITNITLDHTDILGDSLPQIAREKAGIIKEDVPVVIGNVPESAREEIIRIAKNRHSTVATIDRLQPRWDEGNYSINTGEKRLKLQSGLWAPIQANNMAAAWQVTQILAESFPIAEQQFRAGIAAAGVMQPHMGRFEKLHPNYEWYFDGAHNLDAVQAMKQATAAIRPVNESILVLSLMKDKISEKLMIQFSEFKKIVYHTLPLERAATLKNVQRWLPQIRPFPVKHAIPNAILKEFSTELVIFAGSFYFYATVRDWLHTLEDR